MAGETSGLRPDTIQAIKRRIAATREKRSDLRELVADGKWLEAEPDPTRAIAYTQRVDRKAGHAEANDFQPAAFLTEGARAMKAVARVAVESALESQTGTGFLISPRLFLTNQHVIHDESVAYDTQIIFDDELDDTGKPRAVTKFRLDPDSFFLSSDEKELDYALVAVGERVQGTGALSDFGYAAMSMTPDRHRLGTYANIVQHPNGQRKSLVLRNNLIVERDEDDGVLLYETDTLKGSSGAPVFNDLWDVIALHHYGEVENPASAKDASKPRLVNEGIRISSIYGDLSSKMDGLSGQRRALLGDALVLWKDDVPVEKELSPFPTRHDGVDVAGAMEALSTRVFRSQEDEMDHSDEEATIVVPLEVTLRVGEVRKGSALIDADPTERTLTTAPRAKAEAARIDRDYSTRGGFQSDFVPGIELSLQEIVAPVKGTIAPTRAAIKGHFKGELPYENFSVVMHDTRRIAILTATNIDGESYIAINRETGLPTEIQPSREGDTWYKDTRIDEDYTLTNDFYGEWSTYFDRGHLTRRNDPTWGPNARRANYDTFHFTNAAPQHWKFNQTIEFWQGIERYVLEQGLWETGLKRRLAVLQGPLFDAPVPQYADDVLIPNAFWKIIVWNGVSGLKAVGLVADQTRVLPIKRPKSHRRPDQNERADVQEFRSSIEDISKRSGLDFSALVPHDTAGADLPKVGEARELITNFEQFRVR